VVCGAQMRLVSILNRCNYWVSKKKVRPPKHCAITTKNLGQNAHNPNTPTDKQTSRHIAPYRLWSHNTPRSFVDSRAI